MQPSVLFTSAISILSVAARVVAAADSLPTPAVNQGLAGTIQPVASPAPTGWWNVLGSDSLPYDSLQRIPVNIGIMATSDANGHEPRKVSNSLSLTLVASEVGAIRGVQAAGAMNDVHGSVRGVQGTGGLNLVGGNVVGLQGASLNLVHGSVSGVQYGALFNRVGGNFDGWQVGGFGNLTHGEVRGVQSGSIVNKTTSIIGVQDGALNLADRARGLQIGLLNVADDIEGVQFGLVNIADSMTGPQIGLVNVRPDARVFVESWFDETGLAHLGLNYGSPGWYNLLEVAGAGHDSKRFELGLGFGGRVPSERFILSLDIAALVVGDPDRFDKASKANPDSDTLTADQQDAINGLFRARATVGLHLWKRLALFGGASWNILAVPDGGHGSRLLRPYGSYHWDANDHVRMWPGVYAGIRI